VFSAMLGKPKAADSAPEMIWRWTGWEDEAGRSHAIPPHAKIISRGAAAKDRHYALVCYSDAPQPPRARTPTSAFTPCRSYTSPGIVADSDPAFEQQECINKAKALFGVAEEAKRFASAAGRGQ
jgi:hypothetical protein